MLRVFAGLQRFIVNFYMYEVSMSLNNSHHLSYVGKSVAYVINFFEAVFKDVFLNKFTIKYKRIFHISRNGFYKMITDDIFLLFFLSIHILLVSLELSH